MSSLQKAQRSCYPSVLVLYTWKTTRNMYSGKTACHMYSWGETRRVRLIHYSAQEYLLSQDGLLFPDDQHEITTTCLTYMSLDIWQSLNCSDWKGMTTLQKEYPFYEYAARYWSIHARAIPEMDVIVADFLNCQHHQFCSFQSRLLSERGRTGLLLWFNNENAMLPLYHAFASGLQYTVIVLLGKLVVSKHIIRRTYGEQLDSFLQTAAANGHFELISFWLEMGADVNAVYSWEPSPLASAAANGHGPMVSLLLRYGANPWQQDGIFKNAIIAATAGGHNDIVTLLLQNTKTVHLRDSRIITDALRLACIDGNRLLVRVLLDWGPNLDQSYESDFPGYYGLDHELGWEGFRYGTRIQKALMTDLYSCADALQCAATSGHYEITKLLLDHGAAVKNTKSWPFGSTLEFACHVGHEEIIT